MKKRKKSKSKEITKRFNSIAEMGCVICGAPTEIHHCLGAKFGSGKGMKAGDEKTFGLCYPHHRGEDGIHRGVESWEAKYGTQETHLELTDRLLDPTETVILREFNEYE